MMSGHAEPAEIPGVVRRRILVRGAVQGVGFRPFVYGQATALGLHGWVLNSNAGVVIEAEGSAGQIEVFMQRLQEHPPAHSSVEGIESCSVAVCGESVFEIRSSTPGGTATTQVLPDFATCPECLAEVFDLMNRRYRYPFTNCTHCGPRYSIIESMPYDRARTSMRHFAMCASCSAEYANPADRRFHAEPNACPACGPRLALWDAAGHGLSREDAALLATAAALRAGQIVAVKGVGGFHLLCDAGNESAILRLRERKRRDEKPFAVMFPSLAEVTANCDLSTAESDLLTSAMHPIVLLRRIGRTAARAPGMVSGTGSGEISGAVAPGNPWLGALLPYTSLHHLLLRELGFPVVATSGNVTDEPIVVDEHEAVTRLAGLADLYLVHDRPIVRPVDDSVARVVCGRPMLLRRARGVAPAPIAIKGVRSGILAFGGHLKNTVALTHAGGGMLSQHLGDLDTIEARAAHAAAVRDLARLHAQRPVYAVRDLHPDYASSRAAEATGLPVISVQHHVAHVAACMAEHGLEPPVLGVAWDGTGYGPDGTIWGGEFFKISAGSWIRFAKLRPFRLPGGDTAIREPRRSALGLLHEAHGDRTFELTGLPPLAAFTDQERRVLRQLLEEGIHAPWTSSVGRLFDAIASLAGLRQVCTYEGQAAMELEGISADPGIRHAYSFPICRGDAATPWVVDWKPALEEVLADLRSGVPAAHLSAALHQGLAAAIVDVAQLSGFAKVVLTGGCFQNARLTEATVAALRTAGLEPVWHQRVPPNDGGLALGQAAWAAWSEASGAEPCV